MGEIDDSWIWNRRMGHISFDNLVKISKEQETRDIKKITKPLNSVCKNCLHGKKTIVSFKTNEKSTTKPLELVHIDICRPMSTKGLNNESYFIVFIVDYTRMAWVLFLNKKSEAL